MTRGIVCASTLAVLALASVAQADALEIPADASTVATLEAAVARAAVIRFRDDTPHALRLVVEAPAFDARGATVLTLREGLRRHDRRALTARDIVASLQRLDGGEAGYAGVPTDALGRLLLGDIFLPREETTP